MKIKRPMLLCASLCIIIVIAVYYCKTAIFAAIFFVAIAAVANILKFKNAKTTALLLLLSVVIGSASISLVKIGKAEAFSGKTVSESFVITNQPSNSGSLFFADAVCLTDNTLKKGDKIRLSYKGGDLKTGDTLFAEVKLSPIENNEFKAASYSKGIYVSGYIKEFREVSNDLSFLCFLPRLRRSINDILSAAPISYGAKSSVKAITVGDKNDFTLIFEDEVKRAGVSHVFVVSGMHLMVLIASFLKLITKAMYNKYFYAILSFLCVMLFCLICGFTMSVMRAAVMYLLLAIAPLFSRSHDPLNSLGAAVLILTVISPYTIFSIGFQLSAAATLGILLLFEFISQKLCAVFRVENRFLKKFVDLISVTLSATVMTAPIAVYHFEFLSTVTVITNLLISFAITYAMLLSAIGILAGLIFAPFSISSALLYLGGLLLEYSIRVIKYFAALPFSTVSLPRYTAIIFVILAALLVIYKAIDQKELHIISRRV